MRLLALLMMMVRKMCFGHASKAKKWRKVLHACMCACEYLVHCTHGDSVIGHEIIRILKQNKTAIRIASSLNEVTIHNLFSFLGETARWVSVCECEHIYMPLIWYSNRKWWWQLQQQRQSQPQNTKKIVHHHEWNTFLGSCISPQRLASSVWECW